MVGAFCARSILLSGFISAVAPGIGASQLGGHLTVAPSRPARVEVMLDEGDYVHLSVASDRADLALAWLLPDGQRLLTVDERSANDRAEEIVWVAASAGAYVLEVSTKTPGGGEVSVTEQERRGATIEDRALAAAMTDFQRLVADVREPDESGPERAIDALPDLLPRLEACGEGARALRARLLAARALQGRLNRTTEARQRLIELADDAGEAGDLAARALALHVLGATYWREGKVDEAFPYVQRALVDARASGDRLVEANVLTFFATLAARRGEVDVARAAYEDAATIHRDLAQFDAAADAGLGIGNLDLQGGDLEGALRAYEAARQEFEQVGNTSRQQLVGLNIGATLGEMGDYQGAVEAFEKALSIVAREGTNSERWRGLLFVNRGNALESLGRPDDAEESYRRGEEIARREGFEDILSKVVKDRGALALTRGDLDAARPLLEEGLLRARASGAQTRLAAALDELAELERRSLHFERSAALIAEAARIAEQADLADKRVRTRYLQALVERDRGDLDDALASVRAGVAATETVRARLTDEENRATYLASVRELYQLELSIELALDRASPNAGHANAAFAAAERGRARMLVDLLDPLPPVSPVESPEPARASVPRPLRLAERPPLDATGAARDLPADTALLEYVIGSETAALLLVHHGELRTFDLGPSDVIFEAARDFGDELDHPRILGVQRFRDRASRLFDLVVRPALPALTGARRLFVSPDGPLHAVPMAALVMDRESGSGWADLAYLGARFEVRRVPSATVLAALEERAMLRPRATTPLVAFGDPASPSQAESTGAGGSGATFVALPGSRNEVEQIGRTFPEATVFVGEEASETRYKSDRRIAEARILHLAAHSVPDDREPTLSAIILAPGDPSEDGRLTAFEIAGLPLTADLVTVSACESALGRQLQGEGFVGLTQAFLESGATSVLASLRPVSDTATSELMSRFYEELRQGVAPGRALAEAQRAMRMRGGPAHPAYWATFVLIGAPVSD